MILINKCMFENGMKGRKLNGTLTAECAFMKRRDRSKNFAMAGWLFVL